MTNTCSRCRCRPAAPGRKRCTVCAEADRANDAKRRASGWCVECRARKRVKGKTRCAQCAAARAKMAKALADERRADRLCLTCGKAAVASHAYCRNHREYYRARDAATRDGQG